MRAPKMSARCSRRAICWGSVFLASGPGGAVVVAAHRLQPHRVGHAERAQQRLGALRVALDRRNLLGGERMGLLGQLVLQLGHGYVHGERRVAQLLHAGGGPAQHLARHHHTHTAHQHRMRGAVHARFLRRQVNQAQQRRVGRLLAVAGQLVVQRLEAPAKISGRRCTQQLRGTQLQFGPVRQRLASAAPPSCVVGRRHLHRGNFAQVGVGDQHALQLREVGPVAVTGLIGIHTQLPPPAHHLGQLFPGADDIAFLRQQHAISTPQHKRQRVAQLDGFDVQADEVHGGRYII